MKEMVVAAFLTECKLGGGGEGKGEGEKEKGKEEGEEEDSIDL